MAACPSCGHENSETAKFCEECGTPLAAAPPSREQRKVVTVLFCDITGSTALGERLDPEALRTLLARYFERMKGDRRAPRRHGREVHRRRGDGGLRRAEAARGRRAAGACARPSRCATRCPSSAIEGRIGVTTGEVVTGTAERLATGDAVNLAARLEQAARPGRGADRERDASASSRDAVDAEPVEPLVAQGQERAGRRRSGFAPSPGEPARRHGARMVGRERQRRSCSRMPSRTSSTTAPAISSPSSAPPASGSRGWRAEFLDGLDATVVRGRCLSYGDGITLLAGGRGAQAARYAAGRRARRGCDRRRCSASPTSPCPTDEIAWAVRKTLRAGRRTSVRSSSSGTTCTGREPAFLDLVEHVADWSRGAPILLLCMARPELLDRRPGWAGGKVNATTVLLEPLSAEETDELIEQLAPLDPGLRARIREAAEGNPLFVEEMLALVAGLGRRRRRRAADDPGAARRAARPARASPSARCSSAARSRARSSTAARSRRSRPTSTQVPQRLLALVRKELVRPDAPTLAGDDAFRFRHLLIRDAAYDALPKAVRAELHRALRRVARAPRRRRRRARRDRRLPPRAGLALPRRARAAGRRRRCGRPRAGG